MLRSTVLMLAGLLTAAAPRLAGQTPAAAPGSPKLLATWSGTYVTDGPSGPMTLVIAKEGAGWKIQDSLDAAPPPGAIREITADGDKISWKQIFGEYDVAFTAKLSPDGAQLAGTIEASQGGSPAGGGTFTLTKK
jgi:hypothetical protein